ncbi:hypothetical protein EMIHUDRAFT_237029 [Emiliania huxleyi CCMP1516]|uniref:RING-type domain-containing protein n=2 Tax=Emiliania huxleyi TaxID=2903 RepID=A0A0D3JRJ3_EMIH1|nr:hypothetical protein EMIHUDRAFT_237029 [Emiliania huxleyi CCMP1516]EOD26128.1 hypothetical protein EMIHUDRAFT_237029 [Emiliania huxleyi CCMP1516]|eukprot:XP_005778557.1 hypothetical protein EMIHUDRAFT_237029 [Emiliania huxleyi CCMP1516]
MPFFNQQRRLARRRDLKRLGPEEIQRECDAIDAACDEAARARAMARSPPAECAICLGAMTGATWQCRYCGNRTHARCHEAWLEYSTTCPFCRKLDRRPRKSTRCFAIVCAIALLSALAGSSVPSPVPSKERGEG